MADWQYFQTKQITLLNKFDRWRTIAKALKLSSNARIRLEWMIFYFGKSKKNISLVCRHFGISRKTFYKWFNIFNESNIRSLEDRKRSPLNTRKPEYLPVEVERVINLQLKYPVLGREKLAVFYKEEYKCEISNWSMRRIVHDFKLFAKRAVRDKRHKLQPRIIRKKRITELKREPFTGFLIELDTIVIYFSNEKRYIITAIDYHSRFSFSYMYKSKASKHAADFLRRLMLLFGGEIKNIHIDNGSEFKKEFEKAANDLNVTLYHARPYRPKDKPLIERYNGIIQQEYINLGNFSLDTEKFNRNLVEWLIFYNFIRPHHSLGLKRPIDYVNMKSEVLPMYSPKTSH